MRRGSCITLAERRQIEYSLKQGHSVASIANFLNRGGSTLSYEISTSGGAKEYNAERAQLRKFRDFDKEQLKLPFDPPVDIGDLKSKRRPFTRLNVEEVESIKGLINSGVSLREVSRRTGRCLKTVRQVNAGRWPINVMVKKPVGEIQPMGYEELEKRVAILEMQIQILSGE